MFESGWHCWKKGPAVFTHTATGLWCDIACWIAASADTAVLPRLSASDGPCGRRRFANLQAFARGDESCIIPPQEYPGLGSFDIPVSVRALWQRFRVLSWLNS